MKEYLFLKKPTLKKGQRIVTVCLVDNKGNLMYTDWKNACDNKELGKKIKELKKLDKTLDKKFKAH